MTSTIPKRVWIRISKVSSNSLFVFDFDALDANTEHSTVNKSFQPITLLTSFFTKYNINFICRRSAAHREYNRVLEMYKSTIRTLLRTSPYAVHRCPHVPSYIEPLCLQQRRVLSTVTSSKFTAEHDPSEIKKKFRTTLEQEREQAMLGGGVPRIHKQHARGSLTARERLELLFDKNSFHELDQLKSHRCTEFDMDTKKFPGDGIGG